MYLSLRSEVEDTLEAALAALDLPTDDLGIERPPEDVDAAVASSVSFRVAGEVGAPPPEVAADIAAEIDPTGYEYVGRVDTQGPYVNVFPSDSYVAETVETAQSEAYGRLPDRDSRSFAEPVTRFRNPFTRRSKTIR